MEPRQKKKQIAVVAGSFLFGIVIWTGLMFGQHGHLPSNVLLAMGVVVGVAWTIPVIGIVWHLGKSGPGRFWGRGGSPPS